jgi:hypothetical protein
VTEPRRWLDAAETPPEVRALLASADLVRPFPALARERSRRRVLALAALPAAAGAFFWVPHAALGAALGAVVAAVAVAPSLSTPKAPLQNGTVARAPVEAVHAPSTSALSPIPETPSQTPPSAAYPPVEPPKGRARHDAGEHDLTREARLLERARTLLARDPAGALAMLSQHEREFPRGTLETERELLAVDALMRLHRRADAGARAAALRARAPNNLYERRLEQIIDGNGY